jgi:hypothetical protein
MEHRIIGLFNGGVDGKTDKIINMFCRRALSTTLWDITYQTTAKGKKKTKLFLRLTN